MANQTAAHSPPWILASPRAGTIQLPFQGCTTTAPFAKRLANSRSEHRDSPNGTAVERLPNGSPSPGGEGRGEGELPFTMDRRGEGERLFKLHRSGRGSGGGKGAAGRQIAEKID